MNQQRGPLNVEFLSDKALEMFEGIAEANLPLPAGDVIRMIRDIRKYQVVLNAQANMLEFLKKDIQFLLPRADKAGTFSTEENRDFGKSANALVQWAYAGEAPSRQEWPWDASDLAACELAVSRLPEHRISGKIQAKLQEYREHIAKQKDVPQPETPPNPTA